MDIALQCRHQQHKLCVEFSGLGTSCDIALTDSRNPSQSCHSNIFQVCLFCLLVSKFLPQIAQLLCQDNMMVDFCLLFYWAQNSLFALMWCKTHITHSLTLLFSVGIDREKDSLLGSQIGTFIINEI